MASFVGQTGSVTTTGDPGGPTRLYSTTLASRSQVTRWKLTSTRGPRDVTPKAHPQFIGVPSAVEWVAEIEGFSKTAAAAFEPIEWFNALPLSLTLYRNVDTNDHMGGLAWTEMLVHEVIVDGSVRWRARLRMIGGITLV